jgi:hypothetical protein
MTPSGGSALATKSELSRTAFFSRVQSRDIVELQKS